jgi:integrase
MTLEQARRKARLYFGDRRGRQRPDAMRGSASVKMLTKLYIEQHAKPKKRTWKTDEAALNRLLLPRFGSHLAAPITRADISGIHADYGKSHPYGANRFICVVRWTTVGRQLGMIPEEMRNPGTEIQRFPEHKRRRYVTPAEMPRLAAINDDPNEFAGHALRLLLLSDIRRNEILAAKWADVDRLRGDFERWHPRLQSVPEPVRLAA